jgi:urease accessory protein
MPEPLTAPASSRAEAATRAAPGSGHLRVDLVDGRSSATVIAAHAPMKLLVPAPRAAAVWAFASSFGGGLVAGDHLALEVAIGDGAAAAIGTQSSTKVYRDGIGAWAGQSLDARVGRGAALALLPDPVTPFAGSRYRQRLEIDLGEDASLLLVDTCTSGRMARDERWAFTTYDSRLRVVRAGMPLLIDAVRLEQDAGRAVAGRMGRFQAIGTALLLGPRCAGASAALLAWSAAQPVACDAPLLVTASPLADGALVRLAATSFQAIDRCLHQHLDGVAASFGDHWSRKP